MTSVLMPKLGNSVESSLIVTWLKAVGERVTQGEPLCAIETDKAVMEVESPATGVVLERYFEEGDEVPVLVSIAVIGEPGEQVTALESPLLETAPLESQRFETMPLETSAMLESQPVTASQSSPSRPLEPPSRVFASPRAKRQATERGVMLEAMLVGSGPHGRIIERDVLAAAAQLHTPSPSSVERNAALISSQPISNQASSSQSALNQPASSQTSSSQPAPRDGVTAIPIKGIRKRISERMLESLRSTAQLTLHASADARKLLEQHAKFKLLALKNTELPKITLNHLIVWVTARTLKKFSDLNATLEGDTLYQHRRVDLGFAVDTPRGLLVPVLRDGGRLSLLEVVEEMQRLVADCQSARVAPEDLQGGTFTVSNLGGFGIEGFTPILNPPQVAILGVGNIALKPVQIGETVEFHQHLALSLTVNHQVVDGAPAARFVQAL